MPTGKNIEEKLAQGEETKNLIRPVLTDNFLNHVFKLF